MEISPKQQRNMYAFFIGLFAVNLVITTWNIREGHKLRKIQSELAKEQLKSQKKQNSNEPSLGS